MDSEFVLNTVASAAVAVALVFLGGWEGDRRTRRAEARKQADTDRAELAGQADELVAAVLAVRVAGNAYDHLWGSWRARAAVALRAAVQGGAAYGLAGRSGFPAAMTGYGAASGVIGQWDQDSARAAASLAAPMSRLGAAVSPLLRRREPGLAAAAQELFVAMAEDYADTGRSERALEAFQEAVRSALEPLAVPRHRWRLRRHREVSGSQSG
ncbi:hypothetical protein AB0E04_44005 [Streptomyces sp. NPDC048251]|uniref:hypothetical protein n=1 Tax=Streptomyces sp. NPDC048251 TaxID=3154501 RepID=UPI0034407730